MFCLLVVDKNFEVIKVSFAVVAPRPTQYLLDIGMSSLLLSLSHGVNGERLVTFGDRWKMLSVNDVDEMDGCRWEGGREVVQYKGGCLEFDAKPVWEDLTRPKLQLKTIDPLRN